jgi:SWI/SNF related-matrix-associated actin-dependent regulator of chromatin subfamily C
MMSLKVPCAGPFQKAFKEFEQPWFIERLEPVCQALQDSGILNAGQAVLNNPKQLSLLTAGVLQLQQNILGRQSPLANRKMSVLPESLFRDFGPKGALFTILTETIKYLSRMNVALHTFVKFVQQESLETQSTYMDMLLNIRFELEQRNLLPHYRIHFSRNISAKVVSALSAIVKAHGGEVVTSRHACTHQIFPHPSDDAAAMDQALNEVQRSEHVRILDHKDEIAYTHFCYHPPSYRAWLPTTETRGKLEETRPISARWNVCTRFILDLDLFNEWMDEVDYEPESYGEEDSDSADGVAEIENKRKCDFEAAESKKVRIAESELSPPRQLSFANAHNSIAVERVPGLSSESVGGSGTIDTAQGKHVPVEKSDVPIVADATQSTMDGATYATPAHAQPAADRIEPVVVPSYSSWFSFGAVSQVERKQMPDFFENKSPLRNEATYVMIRDFIVKLYRQRPRSHLSVTECRRHIAVDAGAILRIHAFLDHWGLINYDIQPDARPVLLGLSGTGQPVLHYG